MIQPTFGTTELVFLQFSAFMQGILGYGMGLWPNLSTFPSDFMFFYIVGSSPYIISASNTVLLQIDIIFQHSKTWLSYKSEQEYIKLRIQTQTT